MSIKNIFRVGLGQLEVGMSKAQNLVNARRAILDLHGQQAQMIVLPECFNCPYSNDYFREYSEEIPSVSSGISCLSDEKNPTTKMISDLARETKTYIIAGSVPEIASNDRIFNTSVVVDPEGNIIAKHRKLHLFDINVPGKIEFKESKTLTAGEDVTVFDTPYGRIGLGICYDLRFPEYAQACASAGCDMIVFPGAFNTTTGPAHWELLLRSRALDNQLYVLGVSPARNPEMGHIYPTYGHSTVTGPWGDVLWTTGHEPVLQLVELDMDKVAEVRQNIPIRSQKRFDVYTAPQIVKSSSTDSKSQ